MFGLLDAIKIGAGALLGGAGVLLWAVASHGPSQYAAGGIAAATKLEAATTIAIQELSNEADRARFLRRQCLERGGVFSVSTGGCIERTGE